MLTIIHLDIKIRNVNDIHIMKGGEKVNSLNSSMLKETISDSGITITAIAEKMGISRQSLYSKIERRTDFSVSEINALTMILNLDVHRRDCIFFGEVRE